MLDKVTVAMQYVGSFFPLVTREIKHQKIAFSVYYSFVYCHDMKTNISIHSQALTTVLFWASKNHSGSWFYQATSQTGLVL